MPVGAWLSRELQRQAIEHLRVAGSSSTAPLQPRLEMLQLHPEHCSLEAIHAVVEAELVVVVALSLSMIPQGAMNSLHPLMRIDAQIMDGIRYASSSGRILPGDRVLVELSPYDLSRWRIVYRYK